MAGTDGDGSPVMAGTDGHGGPSWIPQPDVGPAASTGFAVEVDAQRSYWENQGAWAALPSLEMGLAAETAEQQLLGGHGDQMEHAEGLPSPESPWHPHSASRSG